MKSLVIHILAVGKGDCLLIELPEEFGVVDSYNSFQPLSDALHHEDVTKAASVIFVCLTHPHLDHMKGIDSILELAAESGGEFWHTIADMEEVLQLQEDIKDAYFALAPEEFIEEITEFVKAVGVVLKKFARDRVRFIIAEPGQSERLFSRAGVEIDVLAPSLQITRDYIYMLRLVKSGELQEVDVKMANSISAVLRVRYGENTIILGGDTTSEIWEQITGRNVSKSPQPMQVQAVKASHHGSNYSFYPGLWQDLFGNKPGIIIVSADGVVRPTKSFLGSFQPRKNRGIYDEIYCTGSINFQQREDSFPLEYLAVSDRVSKQIPDNETVQGRNIVMTIPPKGPITVN
ncbi:hypothetical protein ACFLVX_04555 [Chloroflexota bacterium]